MKIVKKLSALLLVAAIALTACGCFHKKGEVAVTVDGQKFTSAYYMCALLYADMDAMTKVDEQLADENDDDTSSEVDYHKQKIDGKSYSEWVKAEAIANIKENAAYKSLCKKNNLKLDKETKTANATDIANMWSQAQYATFFEDNGVSKATLEEYMNDSSYRSVYFEFLYGKDGAKAPTAAEIDAEFGKSLVLADILQVSFTETDSTTYTQTALSDEEITELKNKLTGYADDLKSGKKTFEDVYHEYNGSSAEDDKPEEIDKGESDVAPQNIHASVLAAVDSGMGSDYESKYFDDINAMAVGEVKIIDLEDNAGQILVVKRDILADKYYRDNYDMSVRHLIKGDELDKEIASVIKDIKTDINDYAVGQFKVKNIVDFSYQ